MTARHGNQPHSLTRQRRDVRGKPMLQDDGDAQIDRACDRVIGSLIRIGCAYVKVCRAVRYLMSDILKYESDHRVELGKSGQ